jgi:hypothetical protein
MDVTRYTVEEAMQLDRYLAFANNKKGEKLRQIFKSLQIALLLY